MNLYPVTIQLGCSRCGYKKRLTVLSLKAQQQWTWFYVEEHWNAGCDGALVTTVPLDDVCPRCANGRPGCTDIKPDGTRYTHEETCATYDWSTDLCPACAVAVEAGEDD